MIDKAKKQDMSQRRQKLKELSRVITSHSSQIASALRSDFGKPEYEAYATEISFIQGEIKNIVKNMRRWSRVKRKPTPAALWPAQSYIVPEPLGKVLVFAPWNYPFQLSMGPSISAYGSGNQVVLKPSAQTPAVSNVIATIVSQVFDPREFSVEIGDRELSDSLLEQKWDLIFFTGSPRIGKIIAEKAASRLTPVVLELGGKSPCIVAPEANIAMAAKRIVWGKFINAGQTCVAPDYLLVHDSVVGELIDSLKNEINKQYSDMKSENFPRIINTTNYNRIKGLLNPDEVIFGGQCDDKNISIFPTLMKPQGWDSAAMKDEIFGPLLPILTWSDESEILDHIDHSPQPLALYYFGRSDKGSSLMRKIAFGGGCINDVLIHLANDHLPFGGVGNSGYGQYHGKFGFDTFTHRKGIVVRGKGDLAVRYRPHSSRDLALTRRLMEN